MSRSPKRRKGKGERKETMEQNIHFDHAPEPDTIIFTCKKVRFDQDDTIVLEVMTPEFWERFNTIVFEAGGKKAIYRKENSLETKQ